MSRKRKSKPKALVDVVIPVLERFDLLGKCLAALPEAFGDHPYRVYIFDNGSEKLVANEFYAKLDLSKHSVIRSHQNVGFPAACNRAFSKGRSPLVFFLNSDVVLLPGSVDYIIRAMDNPKTAVCGMKLIFPSELETQEAELTLHNRPGSALQHICLTTNIRGMINHAFVGWDANHPKVVNIKRTFPGMMVTGAALMTRRDVFRRAGKFDEMYSPGTHEDIDLCLTVQEMGYNVVTVPEAIGVHYTNATAEQLKIGFPVQENYYKFMQKWRGKVKQTDIEVL